PGVGVAFPADAEVEHAEGIDLDRDGPAGGAVDAQDVHEVRASIREVVAGRSGRAGRQQGRQQSQSEDEGELLHGRSRTEDVGSDSGSTKRSGAVQSWPEEGFSGLRADSLACGAAPPLVHVATRTSGPG